MADSKPIFIPVCDLEELPDGTTKAVRVGDLNILLCRSRGDVFAIENKCSHQNTALTGGRLRNGYISCPLHGVRFELATGKPSGQLTRVALQTYAVRVEAGRVEVAP